MTGLTSLCLVATPFTKVGDLDEDAFRLQLRRLVSANVGVYLASGGSGEGHSLTRPELKRIYEIGAQECKGKVPTYANPPEQHTAVLTCEHGAIATAAGVDLVGIYPLAGLHGMRPRENELAAYYDDVLSNVKGPVALTINPNVGYTPTSAFIGNVCRKYPQVKSINLIGPGVGYMLDLKKNVGRPLEFYMPISLGLLNGFALGGNGWFGPEANIIPKTCRQILDLHQSKKFDELAVVYSSFLRFQELVKKWAPSTPRWTKMAFRCLGLPGGQGGVRKPYLMPSEEDIKRFSDELCGLGIPEIDEMARAAK